MGKRHLRTIVLDGPFGSWVGAEGAKGKQDVYSTHLQVQPAVLRVRPFARALLKRKMLFGTESTPEIRIDTVKGLSSILFREPILAKDFWAMLYVSGAESVKTKEAPDKLKVGSYSLLTDTGKMGTFSWSLPAGPKGAPGRLMIKDNALVRDPDGSNPREVVMDIDVGSGTCPGANPGFSLMPADKVTDPSPKTYICGSCYAIKGAYGNASMVTAQEARLMLTEVLLKQESKSGKAMNRFVEVFVEAIRLGQINSMNRRKRQRDKSQVWTIPAPEYFRIHDSGDFYDKRYLESWAEICRHFLEPVKAGGWTLPPITFWAPTRMWAVGGYKTATACMGEWEIDPATGEHKIDPKTGDKIETLHCVPSNLTLRPSALHFGDPPPMLNRKGYAAGSMAGTPEQGREMSNWSCPAYAPPALKGGQVWKVDKETGIGRWGSGTCSRAWGPTTQDGLDVLPMQDGGSGCRACWTRPDLTISYAEH